MRLGGLQKIGKEGIIMWLPNIVGAAFLITGLMGIMLGMALESWMEEVRRTLKAWTLERRRDRRR